MISLDVMITQLQNGFVLKYGLKFYSVGIIMNEKRFSWVKNTHNKYGIIIDNKTGKDVMGTKETCYFMNKLNDENEQLKQRNNHQAERLDELYTLIENKDWKGLTKLVDEMNEAEELNQMEFQAYCGDNDD